MEIFVDKILSAGIEVLSFKSSVSCVCVHDTVHYKEQLKIYRVHCELYV